MSIFEYQAWFSNPTLMLNERLSFAKMIKDIERLIQNNDILSAIDFLSWERGNENLLDFIRRVGSIDSFWKDALTEFRGIMQPDHVFPPPPAKRQRLATAGPSPINVREFQFAEEKLPSGRIYPDVVEAAPGILPHHLLRKDAMDGEGERSGDSDAFKEFELA
jgi:hypothetical protein